MGRLPRPVAAAFATMLASAVALHGFAHAQPVGAEFQVSTYTTSYQNFPAVAADGDGDFVVVWGSYGQDGFDFGVFGQRYTSAGIAQGAEFQVNTFTTTLQFLPAVAADGDGDFVVVWESFGQDGSGYGVFGRRYTSAGIAQGAEFQVNTHTTSDQRFPAVAADGDGDFVVVWTRHDGNSGGVFGQRYTSAGIAQGAEFQINTYTTDNQSGAAVAADGDGDFVVVWGSFGQDGSSTGVFGQRYTSAGLAQGAEFQVNTYTTSFQTSSAVAADGDGDFVVVWPSFGQDGSNFGVFGQRFQPTVTTTTTISTTTTTSTTLPPPIPTASPIVATLLAVALGLMLAWGLRRQAPLP